MFMIAVSTDELVDRENFRNFTTTIGTCFVVTRQYFSLVFQKLVDFISIRNIISTSLNFK